MPAAHRAIAKIYRPELALIGDSLAERCSWRKLRSTPFSVVNLARGGDVLRQIVPQAETPGAWEPERFSSTEGPTISSSTVLRLPTSRSTSKY
jgi:hypothetical protein